uniref:Uncharacterized protein n=1 Tax=Chromera velia CCMP2878 TaxID=1169474 RepID=A0A0G4I9R7_9ALVE|eukprot:Cvel_12322.t1-p1 / transcript=Cvel_12322.t1 / gene=Cvel_12322 / organism=Chromera_velia_CCMP2878 / gene_product=hypothetical protein / transcript_product=hypothetical protein / location=Cvel_scaffold801:40925-46482(+) / protein_length=601 / sequence_SO=supercontig / SO=protein_coding / is_pseudo=false
MELEDGSPERETGRMSFHPQANNTARTGHGNSNTNSNGRLHPPVGRRMGGEDPGAQSQLAHSTRQSLLLEKETGRRRNLMRRLEESELARKELQDRLMDVRRAQIRDGWGAEFTSGDSPELEIARLKASNLELEAVVSQQRAEGDREALLRELQKDLETKEGGGESEAIALRRHNKNLREKYETLKQQVQVASQCVKGVCMAALTHHANTNLTAGTSGPSAAEKDRGGQRGRRQSQADREREEAQTEAIMKALERHLAPARSLGLGVEELHGQLQRGHVEALGLSYKNVQQKVEVDKRAQQEVGGAWGLFGGGGGPSRGSSPGGLEEEEKGEGAAVAGGPPQETHPPEQHAPPKDASFSSSSSASAAAAVAVEGWFGGGLPEEAGPGDASGSPCVSRRGGGEGEYEGDISDLADRGGEKEKEKESGVDEDFLLGTEDETKAALFIQSAFRKKKTLQEIPSKAEIPANEEKEEGEVRDANEIDREEGGGDPSSSSSFPPDGPNGIENEEKGNEESKELRSTFSEGKEETEKNLADAVSSSVEREENENDEDRKFASGEGREAEKDDEIDADFLQGTEDETKAALFIQSAFRRKKTNQQLQEG